MARRIRPEEDVAVPLSGGRDSRHILLELCDAGRRPRLVITLHAFPPFGSEDDIARQVAAAVALPHVILPQRRARFIAEIRKNRITNFCADEHAWYLALADYLEGRARHIYDGIGGDVLSAGLFLTVNRLALFQTGRFEELALHLFQDSGPIIGLLAPQWKTLLNAEVALARLTPELVRHADAPNPVGSFYFWNRTRREIALAPYRILSRSVEVLSPYLDWDLFDFLASLPATLLLDHAFHTETIRRAYPAHADLRFAEPRKLRLAPVEFRRFAAEIAAYALRHAWASTVQLADRQGILTRSAIAAIAGRTDRFNWRLSVLTLYLLQLSHEGTGARR
jgi:hypothetical protein